MAFLIQYHSRLLLLKRWKFLLWNCSYQRREGYVLLEGLGRWIIDGKSLTLLRFDKSHVGSINRFISALLWCLIFESKCNNFHSRQWIWKWHLQNISHFVSETQYVKDITATIILYINRQLLTMAVWCYRWTELDVYVPRQCIMGIDLTCTAVDCIL